VTNQLGDRASVGPHALALMRARRALDAAGVGFDVPVQPVSSVTNEVWFTPELVVRINQRPDQRLGRERLIASYLPPEIGYPKVVSYGGDFGADWLIVERLPGRPLSRCWPSLTLDERRDAIDQLAERLRLIHAIRCDELPALQRTPQLLDRASARPWMPSVRSSTSTGCWSTTSGPSWTSSPRCSRPSTHRR
jgi:aminoglycoside phosphotransferase